tara:strand:+ start:31448 stop:32392 length:945 start_codon:yes stop_codon:yes gene_type:complete
MANVLITGGAGYIGTKLTEYLLAQNHNVTVLDNLRFETSSIDAFQRNDLFQFIQGDARDEELLSKLLKSNEYIFPLAALVGAPLCDKFPEEAVEVNEGSIEILLKNLTDENKIIYPTTNSGYGTKSGDVHCTEETPLEPISLYGNTKVNAEKKIIQSGRGITLRLATIFGTSYRTRFDLMVNNFVYRALKDSKLEIYEGSFKRNFIHINDVCECFLFMMKNFKKLKGETFNLGQDNANMSKLDLAYKIKEQLPAIEIEESDSGNDIDKRNYIVSSEKLRGYGFEASVSIEDGICEMIEAAKEVIANDEEPKRNY